MPYKKSVLCLCGLGLISGILFLIGSIVLGVRNHTHISLSLFATGWIFLIFSCCLCYNFAQKPVRSRATEPQQVLNASELRRMASIQQRPLPPIPVDVLDRNDGAVFIPPPTPQMRYPQYPSPRMRTNIISSQPSSFGYSRQVTNLARDRVNQSNRRYEVHFV